VDVAARTKELGLDAPPLAGRSRFLPETDQHVIAGIRRGILFVMAFWSGPSRQAFAELKRVLAQLDPGGRLELVVVDTDGCPDLYEHPAFVGRMHGAGEAAWVVDGQVVCTSGLGFNPKCFEPYTRHLLAEQRQAEPGTAADGGGT
jgi:hypothetical protein